MSYRPLDLSAAVQSLAASLLAAVADPADAISVLSQLAAFTSTMPTPPSQVGTAMADMQSAMSDMIRRTAVIALARASSVYQPASSDDAINVMSIVTALLDREIQVAGDQHEDATFNALRALRLAVVEDLTDRGARLPSVATFTTPAPQPAATLANRIYRDASRADDLVYQVDPIHPLFMPTTFKALSE